MVVSAPDGKGYTWECLGFGNLKEKLLKMVTTDDISRLEQEIKNIKQQTLNWEGEY